MVQEVWALLCAYQAVRELISAAAALALCNSVTRPVSHLRVADSADRECSGSFQPFNLPCEEVRPAINPHKPAI